MNRTDTAAEPTMEEILASIRKIIADEPGQTRKSPDPLAVNPLIKPAASASSIQVPSSRDAVFGDAVTPAAPDPVFRSEAAKSAPIAIKDDLADLLDAPTVAAAPAADHWASLKSLRSAPAPEAPAPVSEQSAPPAAVKSEPPAPVAAASTGPLARKSGFWPPSPTVAAPATHSSIPAATFATLAVSAPASESAPVVTPTPAISVALSVPLPSSKPMSFSAPAVEAVVAPAAAAVSAKTSVTLSGTPASDAAAALDALALGLAAFGSEQKKPATAKAATPPAPVPAAVAAIETKAPVITVAPAPASSAAPAVRSLEDVISDMMRPMLQQWLTDNMPRIVEKALRVEAAKSVKTNGNGSGA